MKKEMTETATPSVKEILKEMFSLFGTDEIDERIEQLYESFLVMADNGDETFATHWINYKFTSDLKRLFKQARDEFKN